MSLNTLPPPSSFATRWSLTPAVVHLNHGSFGACPTEVLQFQQEVQRRIEENPMQFYARDYPNIMGEVRETVGDFVGAPAEALALVSNATEAVNTVLRSLPWKPGDEILLTDHGYNACKNTAHFIAKHHGVKLVEAPLPFPIACENDVVEAVLEKVTPNTRLALLDHITSPTALLLPIKILIDELRERGVETLIDGAHAPGMVPLDLAALQPTYYTGNFHKWLCTPRGAAFLYVSRDQQHKIRPLSISHGAELKGPARFRAEFDWTGTDDVTALLAVPKAIEFLSGFFEGGINELMMRNHALAARAQSLLADALNIPLPCPESMLGSMAAFPLPPTNLAPHQPDPFPTALFERWKVEIGFAPPGRATHRCFRISAQAYNSLDQYRYLATALQKSELAASTL